MEMLCNMYLTCSLKPKVVICYSGLSGKSQGKSKIFQCQRKVREFLKKSGKFFDIIKVSEKSGNLWVKSNAMCTKSR